MNKKFTKLIAAVALLTLLIPMRGWGQSKTETTTTYIFTAKTWTATCGGSAANWTSNKDGDGFSNNGIQVLGATSGVSGTSPSSFDNITKIVATYNTNKSQGAGTLKIKIGDNSEVSHSIAYSGSGDGRTANFTSQFDYATAQSGSVKVTVDGSTNSIYLVSVAITTTSGGGSGTATTTTISDAGITNTNVYTSTVAGSLSATVTETESGDPVSGATVTWSGNNDDVATINSTTGAVTLVGAGTVTFTASYAGDATYNSSSDTYEMTVTNENPALTTIWSEDFSSYSADDVPSGGTYSYSCTGSGTKIYAASLAGGTSPELLVAKSGGSFTATIPLLTSTYCYSGDLTLTFKTNNTNIAVSTTTSGVTVSGTIVSGANTITLSGVTESTESVVIAFTNSNSSNNVRLDDIVLKGEQAALTKVATPVISPASGAVASGTEVTITCATDGASIYYTIDGTVPSSSSIAYNPSSKPTITAATTLKAIAVKDGLTDSDVASATYTIAEPCAIPTFSVAAGEVVKGTTVTISTETDGATIYYTTDGTDPTTSSSTYSSAITINTAMTIKAFAVKEGNAPSAVASAAYTIIDYATMPFSFTGGKSSIETTTGLTQSGLGTDYSDTNSKLKFDDEGDYVVLKLNSAPKAITFNIKGNGFSGGTFNVQISTDNTTYEDLATYTDLASSNKTFTLLNTNSEIRYLRWIYTDRSSGNVGLGNIYVDEEYLVRGNATVSEDLTIIACEIRSEGKLTIESGATFTVTEPYALNNGGNSSNLVIKDGGQLKTPNEVYATVEKNITGYGTSTKGNYYLVSAPAQKYLYVASDNDDVDAYHFDASEQGAEWRNFKLATGAWHIAAGNAVLYATKENSTLSLDGYGIVYNTPNPGANIVYNKVPATNADVNVDVVFNSGKTFEGFNLIGNPFTCKAYITPARNFYRMNPAGDGIVLATDNAINVCEGIFVVAANSEDNKVTFTTTAPSSSAAPGEVNITLNQAQTRGEAGIIDVVRISFSEGNNLPKLNLLGEGTMLYIPQGSKDYSVVCSNGQGEMPLNFKAAENGSYTLSFSTENAEMDYLHLIDNMTGADIDLLQTPSYTFNARTTDYASRFRLVFSANSVDDNASTGSETFAFFNGSEWVINASANATLQVVDMMGRIVLSTNGANTVSTNGMAQGVYVMRLVNGNDVKTQKIVVQ